MLSLRSRKILRNYKKDIFYLINGLQSIPLNQPFIFSDEFSSVVNKLTTEFLTVLEYKKTINNYSDKIRFYEKLMSLSYKADKKLISLLTNRDFATTKQVVTGKYSEKGIIIPFHKKDT